MNVPKFHVIEFAVKEWPNVVPGDVVVAPGTWKRALKDFYVDGNEQQILTGRHPEFVISRIDKRLDHSTLVLYSITRGLLVTVVKCEKSENV